MADSNDIDKRVRYFTNQLLTEQDMTAEQDYHLDRERRLIRSMYTPGIVSGLELALAETGTIVVKPGTAIDASGRQIVLASARTLILIGDGDTNAGHTDQLIPFLPIPGLSPQPWLLAISYSEVEDPDSKTSVGSKGNNRWLEAPAFALLQEGSPQAGIDYLVLGKLSLSISDNSVSIDPLVPEDQKKARIYAGIKLEGSLEVGGKNDSPVSMKDVPLSVRIPDPNLAVEKDGTITINQPVTALRLSREGVPGKSWQDIAEFSLSRFDRTSYYTPDSRTQLDIGLTNRSNHAITNVLSLRSDGMATLNGGLSATALSVAGNSTLGSLSVTNSTDLNSLTVAHSTSLNTLSVAGDGTLNSLTVTNNANLKGLAVSGTSTLNSLTVTKTASLTGAIISGDLTVSGSSNLTGDVKISGNFTFHSKQPIFIKRFRTNSTGSKIAGVVELDTTFKYTEYAATIAGFGGDSRSSPTGMQVYMNKDTQTGKWNIVANFHGTTYSEWVIWVMFIDINWCDIAAFDKD